MSGFDWSKHVSFEDGRAQLDHIEAIADLTDTRATDWTSIDGPDSGVGVDYWYAHQGLPLTAYVSDDQGHLSIAVTENGGETIAIADIDLDQFVAK